MPTAFESGEKASIEVENLSKFYGEFKALDNVTFTIRAGEIVGFLGPNGAGKTTTMKILTCFMGASSGKVRVAGYDVNDQSLEVRKRVGYLPETVPLYKDMIVYDYLKFVAEMRLVPKGKIHEHIKDTAKVCGLSHMINRSIGELSKGYKQRVGLAQALIHKPEVVILDEPTSGLDPNQIIEIRDLIKEIGKEKTIIFSTHILQEVAAVCDRVLIIDKGKLIADGNLEELERKVQRDELYVVTLALVGASQSADELQALLHKVGPVKKVEQLSARGRELTFLITAERGADLRHDIFRLAETQGLALLELQRERLSLEDIFRALTGDADLAAAERRSKVLASKQRSTELDPSGGEPTEASGQAASPENDADEGEV
jgi:ABC-2 type transport system ATP-binding protein